MPSSEEAAERDQRRRDDPGDGTRRRAMTRRVEDLALAMDAPLRSVPRVDRIRHALAPSSVVERGGCVRHAL